MQVPPPDQLPWHHPQMCSLHLAHDAGGYFVSGSTAHVEQSVNCMTSILLLSTSSSSMQCQPVLSHLLIQVQPAGQSPHFVAEPQLSDADTPAAQSAEMRHTSLQAMRACKAL